MTSRQGSYPHPVLGDTDDVNSVFEVVNFTYAPSVDDIRIRFQMRLNDEDMTKLLNNGEARYSFRWTCSSTISSRELDPSPVIRHPDGTTFEGWIDQQEVRGKVRMDIQILANQEIVHYRLSNQHPDYGDATFHIMPGDVLAYAGPFEFEPQKRYDALDPPVGALFRFVDGGTRSREIKVRFDDDDQVLVVFDPDLLAGLAALSTRTDLQISLVVLPALMEAITYLKDNSGVSGEDLTERGWYEPLCRLVTNHGGFDQPAFNIAQRILGHPLDTSLRHPFEIDEDDQ